MRTNDRVNSTPETENAPQASQSLNSLLRQRNDHCWFGIASDVAIPPSEVDRPCHASGARRNVTDIPVKRRDRSYSDTILCMWGVHSMSGYITRYVNYAIHVEAELI